MVDVSRRDFLKIAAASTAGAIAYAGCSPFPTSREFLAQSTATLPEDLATGMDNWYASVCRECRGGCGIIVRVDEGRALKIEGNPEYPVNMGKLCARGQNGVQALYHPDRLRGPMRRIGERGRGEFEPITWQVGHEELVSRLRGVASGAQGRLLIVSEPAAGHRGLVLDRLAGALGGQYAVFEALPRAGMVAEAVRRVFGQTRLPHFDIARSQYLLSFGADFLGTWLSPVQYNRAYGEFRQGRPNRGYFVQIEPRLSQTGANADEWLAVNPGSEGLLALSIGQVLLAEGKADAQAAQALLGARISALEGFAPQRTAQAIGLSADRITALARDFAAQRPALAIGGDHAMAHTNGLFNLTAIYALNVLAGSVGRPGGVVFSPPSPFPDVSPRFGASFADWQRMAQQITSGQNNVGLLLVHDANPVYGLPPAAGMREALAKVPYIVSFSSLLDETSALADLILPDHAALEAWGDEIPEPQPGVATVGWQQPLVNPQYDTRDYVDELIAAAGELGDDVKRALPFGSYQDVLRAAAQQLQALRRGSATGADAQQFFVTLQQKGGWWDQGPQAPVAEAAPAPTLSLPAEAPRPSFAGSAQEYPYHLVVYPHLSLGSGDGAHLPWGQATPDPMTTVAWETWIEINPELAEELGLEKHDLVTVTSPNGTVEVPAYPYPAIPRDVVAMPLGQGHKLLGRWAEQRGVNPLSIIAPLTDAETGALAWNATRVNLSRTRRRAELPLYEGVEFAVESEPGTIVPTAAA